MERDRLSPIAIYNIFYRKILEKLQITKSLQNDCLPISHVKKALLHQCSDTEIKS